MTETLESLLNLLCKSVSKGQQNAQQTLYILGDAKDAKLAYDVLVACGVDAKYFAEADESGGKLYVQNAALAASGDRMTAALASAPLLKQIKDLLDAQSAIGNYSLAFSNTQAGRQLTLLLPADKSTMPVATAKPAAPLTNSTYKPGSFKPKIAVAEESILTGPAVARKAIPKSFKTSDTEEDPLIKRMLFYITSHAFTSIAWVVFFILILGVIFSVVITVRGFLCPDIAGVMSVPAYCPHKVAAGQQ